MGLIVSLDNPTSCVEVLNTIPQRVTIFGDGVFTEVTKLK